MLGANSCALPRRGANLRLLAFLGERRQCRAERDDLPIGGEYLQRGISVKCCRWGAALAQERRSRTSSRSPTSHPRGPDEGAAAPAAAGAIEVVGAGGAAGLPSRARVRLHE